jgi:ABC-type Fe3+/spermidine/putrescine transport system ATPase subunit
MIDVQIEHLVKHYGAQLVLPSVSFSVAAGERFVLLGKSGGGKTTLLKLIAGLLVANGGDIRFNGASMQGVPPQARECVYLFQEPLLFPHLNVADNIGFGLKMRGIDKSETASRVQWALQKIELENFDRRKPSQLSGGQAQRVALARALVIRPKLLLLDEPFSGLDAALRDDMRKLVCALQEELGFTMILVTHDQMEAAVMAHRIGVMIDGRLEQIAAPRALFQSPQTPAVAAFLRQSLYADFIDIIGDRRVGEYRDAEP